MSENQGPSPTSPLLSTRKRGVQALFWGMLVRPRATLTDLRDAGAGGASWIWPALLAVVVLIVSTIAIAPITRAAAEEQLAQVQEQFGENIPPEGQAQIRQVTSFASNPLFTIAIPAVSGVFGLVIGWLIRSGVLYLAGLALGGHTQFSAMFRMGVWTALPDVARQVVTTVGTLSAGRILASGLASLVTLPETGLPSIGSLMWQAFLRGVDVYWLWGLALTVIGVAVTAQLSWRKSLIIALGYWLLTVAFSLALVGIGAGFAAQVGGAVPVQR